MGAFLFYIVAGVLAFAAMAIVSDTICYFFGR